MARPCGGALSAVLACAVSPAGCGTSFADALNAASSSGDPGDAAGSNGPPTTSSTAFGASGSSAV